MAGGQERILRGRIRSVQATKKITRAMELIAASRIVKAQQRVAAAVPYSDQITEVVKDLAAAGGVDGVAVARRRETSGTSPTSSSPPTAVCAAATTPACSAPPRARSKPTCCRAATTRVIAVGRKAESYFRFRGYKIEATFSGFSDTPELRRRQRHRPARHRSVRHRRRRPRRAGLHPVHLCWLARGRATTARTAGARHRRRRRLRREADGRPPTSSTSRSDDDPRRAAAEVRRGPHLRRAAQRRGQRACLPSTSHEERHRQCRGTDQEPQPHHEPGPSGLDHHRDHGDRQRRRGARPATTRVSSSTSSPCTTVPPTRPPRIIHV